MKRGFTLIEILVAMVIVGILVGTAAVSLRAGVKSAQMATATRAVQQYAGHARTIALLKQRPVTFTIKEVVEDGVFSKSVLSITYLKDDTPGAEGAVSYGAGFGAAGSGGNGATTLSGLPVDESEADSPGGDDEADDPLAPEARDFVGLHIKGQLKDDPTVPHSRISVFSTADYQLRQSRLQQEKKQVKDEVVEAKTDNGLDGENESPDEESEFSIVYEPNGRCTPYFVKLWKDGMDEENAVSLEVGCFGRVVDDEDKD